MTRQGLTLKSMTRAEDFTMRYTYEAAHITPGRNGTILKLDVHMSRKPDGTWTASIDVGPVSAATQSEACEKLVDWCSRAAWALATGVPAAEGNEIQYIIAQSGTGGLG